MGRARALPERVHLPSGLVVVLSDAAARRAAAASDPTGGPGSCARDVAVLGAAGVLARDGDGPVDVEELSLRDLHVLRALLAWASVVEETQGAYTCENCAAPLAIAPSAQLEIAPFVDGELDDADLDGPFTFDEAKPIPPIRVPGGIARSVRLAPRTAREARALLARRADAPLRVTPAIVAAMGVAALGSERRASAIARALSRASDEAWCAIVDLYNDAHYPPRLRAAVRCAACGARNDVEAPLVRELEREPLDHGSGAVAFPNLDAFEGRVRSIADRLFAARRVRGIGLYIDADVPACDAGGEPLLGSYTPAGADPDTGIEHTPEIRLFYRTFQSEFSADPTFDWEDEIRETIDHELQHHLHDLAGVDPLDDAERAEIEDDELRRVGRRELRRRAGQSFAKELVGFLRSTWPIWLIVGAGSALAWCADRGG